MEITADTLVELCEEFTKQVEEYKKVEPKVDTSNLVSTFSDDERSQYADLIEALDVVDRLIHANYNSRMGLVVNENVKKFAADCKARTDYLVSIETKAVKVELDEDSQVKLEAITKLRKKIEATKMMLEAEGIELPASLFKKSEKTGNLVWNLPKTPGDTSSKEDAKPRGRTPSAKLLILGTEDESGHIDWYDFDHINKAFDNLFGTVRSDACAPGLMSAVEKAGIENPLKSGWTTPVEYAGYNWVAKVREAK